MAAVATFALLGACKDSTGVPDLNNVSLESVKGGLTPSSAQLLVTGLLNQDRNSAIGNYIVFGETFARDAYRIDVAETRYITELIGPNQPDVGAFTGGGVFTGFYVGIRAANTILAGLPGATGLSATDKAGISGLTRTIKALEYYRATELRDSVGAPIDLDRDITADPAPFVCKPNVLAFVSALLDSAATDLRAGGGAFSFQLPVGYSDFSTPQTFLKFNRALKGKVELYRALNRQKPNPASFDAAIAAINQSYIDPTADAQGLQFGPFQSYSTAAGETPNALVDPALHLNPQVKDSILPTDTRASKIVTASTTYSGSYSGSKISTQYNYVGSVGGSALTRPLPILKNEELLLLRAQAEIGKGDLVGATSDINAVHTKYGNAPYPLFLSAKEAIDAVLYEKRYSLLFEGPQRLVDLRTYGRLNAANYKPELPGDVYTSTLGVPLNEAAARGNSVTITCP